MNDEDFNLEDWDGKLFAPGFCEFCGRTGAHPDCEIAAVELTRRFQETDTECLQQYSLYGCYGIKGEESATSLEQARNVLEGHLGRPLEHDVSRAVENQGWWFLPEGWIGMIGFIVEKNSGQIFALGSGLVGFSGLKYHYSHWCAIKEYLAGRVPPDAPRNEKA